MEYLQIFFEQYGELLLQGTWDTIVMTLVSTVFAYIIGIPLGVAVVLTDPKKGLLPHRAINAVLGWIINIGRSIPFIILLVAIIPFTRLVVGTSLGVPGAIVPLVVSAAPFVGRMVEQSLAEVDASLIEAAQSFGATVWQIVIKVYLMESLPSLIRGFSITLITLGNGGYGRRGRFRRYRYSLWLSALHGRHDDCNYRYLDCGCSGYPKCLRLCCS